jgi:hypothetical protein
MLLDNPAGDQFGDERGDGRAGQAGQPDQFGPAACAVVVQRLQDAAPALVAQTVRFVDDDASPNVTRPGPRRPLPRRRSMNSMVPLRLPLGFTSIYGLFTPH